MVALNRLNQVSPCFPRATVIEVDGDRYRGSVKIKVGPLPLGVAVPALTTRILRGQR